MVTHWESSKRPLYFKTVWKDGQHHVILNCRENIVPNKKVPPKCSFNSVRSVKSAPSSSSSHFNVSTLKLLDTEDVKPHRRCKTSNKSQANLSPKYPFKIFTKQVSVNSAAEKNIKNIPLSINSNSIDLDTKNKSPESKSEYIKEACLSLSNFEEPRNESLTDRVLMWLDLAIQSGNYPKPITINPPLETYTVQPVTRKRQTFAKHRCYTSYHVASDYEASKYSFHVEGTAQPLQESNNPRIDTKMSEQQDGPVYNEEEALVSSRLEENVISEDIVVDDEPKRKFGMKRQLHIFLPNLQKKVGLYNSDLSDQLSASSFQKIDDSREI
ncbi:uncharacterized protein LOC126888231 [Diabrotica virgifera virgifera]|uniref:Uncharacterized protein n=1 Tax=Diabrotica virgifera virgifera TaxID=50390 RepID=A0ABM5KPZ0_DIAVI|nr:uncharacterized protein LOC126888231 [Diabrotica virgifera virgifera]